MSRPKPTILLEWTNPKTYKTEQVLMGSAIYAVYYDGKPINLRSINSLINYPGPKYRKTSFINSSGAFNLCEKLNKLFKTNKFEVYELTAGNKIQEK